MTRQTNRTPSAPRGAAVVLKDFADLAKAAQVVLPQAGGDGAALGLAFTFDIAKVDAEQRMVQGWANADCRDLQGDRIPLEVSKSAFSKYFPTMGVREMHQPRAVGRLDKWWVDDVGKRIGVQVYISKSRDGEDVWIKVQEHILKGFSIGGKALDWTHNGTERVITDMALTELSLVDVPANPQSVITLFKVEGDVQKNTVPTGVPSVPNAPAVAMLAGVENNPETLNADKPNPGPSALPKGVIEVPVPRRDTDAVPPAHAVTGGMADEQKVAGVPITLRDPRKFGKGVEDAPGLREIEYPKESCGNCKYFRTFGAMDYCRKYDFNPKYNWWCESFEPMGANTTDPLGSMPPAETTMAGEGTSVVPSAVPVAAPMQPIMAAATAEPQAAPTHAQETAAPQAQVAPDTNNNAAGTTMQPDQAAIQNAAPAPVPQATQVPPAAPADVSCPNCGAMCKAGADGSCKCAACGVSFTAGMVGKLAADLMTRAERVGIMRKSAGKLNPPRGYPTEWQKYGDPANWLYPMDKAWASLSIARYNEHIGKAAYDRREWAILGRRITRLANELGDAQYTFDPAKQHVARQVAKGATSMAGPIKKDMDLQQTLAQAKAGVNAALHALDSDPSKAADLLNQVQAALDVAGDAHNAEGQGGGMHAQPVPGDGGIKTAGSSTDSSSGSSGGSGGDGGGGAMHIHIHPGGGGGDGNGGGTPSASSSSSTDTHSETPSDGGHSETGSTPGKDTNPDMESDTRWAKMEETMGKMGDVLEMLANEVVTLKRGKDTAPTGLPAGAQPVYKSAQKVVGDIPGAKPAEATALEKAIAAGDISGAVQASAGGGMPAVYGGLDDAVKKSLGRAGIGLGGAYILNQFPNNGQRT